MEIERLEKMKFSDLQFVRLDKPVLFGIIPPYLFDQIKNKDFETKNIFAWGAVMAASPLSYIYALKEPETNHIKGVLWFDINPIEERFYVQLLSVDKEYQNDKALEESLEFIKSIPEYKKLKPEINMSTRHPKAFEKAGWKRAKKVRMVI